MNDRLRCFIAIDLDEPVKELIGLIQHQLSAEELSVKWVKPHLAHLTMKFLGDVAADVVPVLHRRLDSMAAGVERSVLRTSGVGAFPHLKQPRIIWLGVKENAALLRLSTMLDQELRSLRIPTEDRAFSAHITIGRAKPACNLIKLSSCIEKLPELPAHEQILDRMALYKSTLTPSGPIYERLFESALGKNS